MSLYKILMSVLIAGLCALSNAKVYTVKFEGLRLITEETVESLLKIPLGEDLTQEDIKNQIQVYYDTGMFQQVAIFQKDDVLLIKLTEQPVIQKIIIDAKISESELKSNLNLMGIIRGELLNERLLEEWRIQTQVSLRAVGYHKAKVSADLEKGYDATVIIKVKVDTESSTKVSKIHFEGNSKIAAFQLKRVIRSSEPGLLSFLFPNNLYADATVQADQNIIADYYRSKGYLNPEVSYSIEGVKPSQRMWSSSYKNITFKIDEGPIFKVGKIHLQDSEDEWDSGIQSIVDQHMLGKVYSYEYMQSLDSIIRKYYLEKDPMAEYYDISFRKELVGYDEVDGFLTINKDIKKVRFINFSGNKTTLDESYRRVVKVQEGQPFNRSMLAQSAHAIRGMSFVKSVNASDVAIQDDLYDIVFAVKEVNTFKADLKVEMAGELKTLGLSASLTDENILGTGNKFDFSVSAGFKNMKGMVSYTIPNLNVDRHSLSLESSFSKRNKDSKDTSSYHVNQLGLSSTYFIPLGDQLAVTLGGGYTHSHYVDISKASKDVRDFFAGQSDQTISQLKISPGIRYREIDSGYMPTTGVDLKLHGTVSLPIDDIRYYELVAQGTAYYPLGELYSQPLVLIFDTQVKYGNTYGSSSDSELPFFARYYAGGLGTVRGYAGQSLGPKYEDQDEKNDIKTMRAKGGNKLVVSSIALQLPSPNPDLMIPYLYVDYGNVFDDSESVSFSDMRGSFGVSTVLNLPIGKFTLSYGMPFNDGDAKFSNFSFGAGSIYN